MARFLERQALTASYPLAKDRLKTERPDLYEAHRPVEEGAPCLPLKLCTLDPLVYDQNAIDLRRALNRMRQQEPEFYHAAIDYALSRVPMRDFNAITTQFEVFPTAASQPDKRQWPFGTVAVFIHAYYPEMIDELPGWALNIPAPADLFISTASEDSPTRIQARLMEMGFEADAVEVRAVEQNRGRDMSALFITFRDINLEGRYQVTLRLHSKRTPQVSDRVAEGFKAHLFENLAYSREYVANLLDRLEAEPDIGLVIPPVIHVGFGTLRLPGSTTAEMFNN